MTRITYTREEMLAMRDTAPRLAPVEIPLPIRANSTPKFSTFFHDSCKLEEKKYRFYEDPDPDAGAIAVDNETNSALVLMV